MTPDATLNTLQKLNDPTRWVVCQGVPVFKPHERVDPATNKLIQVDVPKLYRIVGEMQKLERQHGVPVRITIGHTKPGADEKDQPPVAGYYRNARVGTFGPSQEPAILADEWLDPRYARDRKNYPYRSSEYYDDACQITGVALLTRDPFLDLGVVAYEKPGIGVVSDPRYGVIHYSRDAAHPTHYHLLIGDAAVPVPTPGCLPLSPPAAGQATATANGQPVTLYPTPPNGSVSTPSGPTPFHQPAPAPQPTVYGQYHGLTIYADTPVGRKISHLMGEGKSQKEAEAIALDMDRRGELGTHNAASGQRYNSWENPGADRNPRDHTLQHPHPQGNMYTHPHHPAHHAAGGPMHPGTGYPPHMHTPGGSPGHPHHMHTPGEFADGRPLHHAGHDDMDGLHHLHHHLSQAVEHLARHLSSRGHRPHQYAEPPDSPFPTSGPSSQGGTMDHTHPIGGAVPMAAQTGGGPGGQFPAGPAGSDTYGRNYNYSRDTTISGLPVGYQLELDKRDARLRDMEQLVNGLMYERDAADTEWCVMMVRRLADQGYSVTQYEVDQLKAMPRGEQRDLFLQHIQSHYSRVGTEPLPPMYGDPTPGPNPMDRPATEEEVQEALRLSRNTPGTAAYFRALHYVRTGQAAPPGTPAGFNPAAFGPPSMETDPNAHAWNPGQPAPEMNGQYDPSANGIG